MSVKLKSGFRFSSSCALSHGVKTGIEPVSQYPQCRMFAITPASPFVRKCGLEPQSSVWKTEVLAFTLLTPCTRLRIRTLISGFGDRGVTHYTKRAYAEARGIEPLSSALQTAA